MAAASPTPLDATASGREGKFCVVLDGQAHHDGKWLVILDGSPVGAGYDEVVSDGPSFRDDGKLEFLGTRDRVLYRVTADPGSKLPLTGAADPYMSTVNDHLAAAR